MEDSNAVLVMPNLGESEFFAVVGEDSIVTAFYTSEIHTNIPPAAIKIDVAAYIELKNASAFAKVGKVYKDGTWEVVDRPARPIEEIIASNTTVRDSLLSDAAALIGPLQDMVDDQIANAEEATKLAVIRKYRIEVMRTALDVENPSWPTKPE